ncbi:MAG: hypothetical protein IBJ10_04645 [Phycisphaerales bacterium]|nr:hypothetical protein [Phycisphaerales bacterium]
MPRSNAASCCFRRAAGCGAALTLLAAGALGASPDEPPPGAVAWWRMDPSRFSAAAPSPEVRAQREAMLAMVRSAVTGGAVGEGRALGAVRGLLAASEVGARAHTLSVLEFSASRPPVGAGMDVERLQMALSIRAEGGHERFLPTIRSILLPPAGAGAPPGRQRAFDLPGGARAVAYTEDGWEPWREVSWASTPGAFVVGLGRGALERASGAGAGERPWGAHRALVDGARAHGEVFFEAYLGVARLRSAFPEAFDSGRVHRTLDRLGLLEARDFMLHARFVERPGGAPPLIAIDATWTARGGAEPQRLELTLDHWPQDAGMPSPPGSYVIVAPMDWPAFAALGLDLWLGANVDVDIEAKRAALEAWRAQHGAELDRFIASLGGHAVISDYPTPLLPIPGAATVFVPLREDAKGAPGALDGALSPFRGAIQRDRAGVSSYGVDPVGLMKMPGWLVMEDGPRAAFVAAWTPGAAAEGAAWLRGAPVRPGTSPKSSPSPRR